MFKNAGIRDLMSRLLRDQRGTIEVSSWFALVVMVALGLLVGLTNMRNEITQQFGDVAQALEALDQSYSYSVNSVTSTYNDVPALDIQVPSEPPAGIDVQFAASSE